MLNHSPIRVTAVWPGLRRRASHSDCMQTIWSSPRPLGSAQILASLRLIARLHHRSQSVIPSDNAIRYAIEAQTGACIAGRPSRVNVVQQRFQKGNASQYDTYIHTNLGRNDHFERFVSMI